MRKLLFILFILTPIFSASAAPYKILIVPGHDDESFGAVFNGVKESDMNVKTGLYLYDLLKKDKKFKVFITRDWKGYTKEFNDYFTNNGNKINDFIKNSKTSFQDKIISGEIKNIDNGVYHNNAASDMAQKLYGVNLWANENNVDAVIHIHFNDYLRDRKWERGDYKGFVIYTPDNQFKFAKESADLAAYIFYPLRKYYEASNYPPELAGMVPDQGLIATGSNDTVNTRRILIEYGYIYERKFSTFKKRQTEMSRMAEQTYSGIQKYFEYFSKIKK